jgi:hypothetical protein
VQHIPKVGDDVRSLYLIFQKRRRGVRALTHAPKPREIHAV